MGQVPAATSCRWVDGPRVEVLGYDDSMSTDHTWFARVTVSVPDEVLVQHGESLPSRLTARIPELFEGPQPRSA